MADLAANLQLKTRARSGYGAFPIANTVTLYVGALVQLQAGFANHWDETDAFLGIVLGDAIGIEPGAALLGNTSATPVPQVRVDMSGATIMGLTLAGTPTAAKVGDLVFCATSNIADATLTDTTNPPIGWMSAYHSATNQEVTLFTPEEHAAGIADATWNA